MLLDGGAGVNAKTGSGWSPLHVANGKDTIDLLLARGAEIGNIYDAARLGDMPKLRQFLAADRRLLDKPSNEGWTPLQYAASAGQVGIVRFLVSLGADVSARDDDGDTPLHNTNSPQVAVILLAWRAYVNARNNDWRTPLHYAAMRDSREFARTLLDYGADPELQDKDHKAPLHFAAAFDNVEVAEVLLKQGADVNAKGNHSQTPLHYTALYGQTRAVAELLLSRGANVKALDDRGCTPLGYAQKWGHVGIAEVIRKHGGE
jgi:ankyrin repeat protein